MSDWWHEKEEERKKHQLIRPLDQTIEELIEKKIELLQQLNVIEAAIKHRSENKPKI